MIAKMIESDTMEMQTIIDKVLQLQREVAAVARSCGRDPQSVQIVFATKYITADSLLSFLIHLQRHAMSHIVIGENRVQSAAEKFSFLEEQVPILCTQIQKVLIGRLQKNKITNAIAVFDEIHSIESVSTATALSHRLSEAGKEMPIFLQVNVSGEQTKQGIAVTGAGAIIESVRTLPGIHLTGLMTMAPLVSNPEETRPIFRTLRQLADQYALQTSMGMSNDWRVAVEEGSDMIRIGSSIFRS